MRGSSSTTTSRLSWWRFEETKCAWELKLRGRFRSIATKSTKRSAVSNRRTPQVHQSQNDEDAKPKGAVVSLTALALLIIKSGWFALAQIGFFFFKVVDYFRGRKK